MKAEEEDFEAEELFMFLDNGGGCDNNEPLQLTAFVLSGREMEIRCFVSAGRKKQQS